MIIIVIKLYCNESLIILNGLSIDSMATMFGLLRLLLCDVINNINGSDICVDSRTVGDLASTTFTAALTATAWTARSLSPAGTR